MDGIDISTWQAGLDVAGLDAGFVICKATEGNGYVDPEFARFAKAIKSAGRLRGFYHFARADLNTGEAGAVREADWFVSVVRPHLDGETALVLDWEAGSVAHGPTWAGAWLARVYEVTGVRPMVYMSTSVANGWDWSTVAKVHPLWLANYGTNPQRNGYQPPSTVPRLTHWGGPVIYQYGSKGRLPGWGGNLDFNRAYITPAQWKKLAQPAPEEAPMPSMQSPVEGWVSSPYGGRGVAFHAGMDIACDLGDLVYPMFRTSTVVMVVTDRKPGQTSAGHPIPGRSPNGVLVKNPDGEHQWYGHVFPHVRVGDVLTMRDPLGPVDLSGQTTGPHVHVETWTSADPGTHRDPQIYFTHHGVTPGSKPHSGDWFDMATEAQLRAIVKDEIDKALHNKRVPVTGTVREFEGSNNASFARLSNLSAAAYTQGLNAQKRSEARDLATLAAIEALANSKGANGAEIATEVAQAVEATLSNFSVTLSTQRAE